MMTVHEVSRLTGVSIRTLQYYDRIGLLSPAAYTESGYRLYDNAALERLQQILLFRELEFALKDIKKILDSSDFDRDRALEQQIRLLAMKREHIDNLISLARDMKEKGGRTMDFGAFDKSRMNEYAKQARESWGETAAYKEFEKKSKGRTLEEEDELGVQLMAVMAEFGSLKSGSADAPAAQEQVRKLRDFISAHYYNCTDAILSQLGQMYACGGDFTANINAAGGDGTAEFANEAIQIFCRQTNEDRN